MCSPPSVIRPNSVLHTVHSEKNQRRALRFTLNVLAFRGHTFHRRLLWETGKVKETAYFNLRRRRCFTRQKLCSSHISCRPQVAHTLPSWLEQKHHPCILLHFIRRGKGNFVLPPQPGAGLLFHTNSWHRCGRPHGWVPRRRGQLCARRDARGRRCLRGVDAFELTER